MSPPTAAEAGHGGAHPFRLVPFRSSPSLAAFELEGHVARNGQVLQLRYRLRGPLGQLLIPEPATAPQRWDGLWQHTCFEAFWAVSGNAAYWELNLSPAGHWNLYRLSGYRQDLVPEPSLASLPLQVRHGPGDLALELELKLPPSLGPATPLQLAVTAVLEHRDRTLSTWALVHPGPEADFHRRDGFLLEL
jgi:hypothetical protein